MSAQEQVDICSVCLRWTLHNKTPNSITNSFEFRFEGGGWQLYYEYVSGRVCRYTLSLSRCSGAPPTGPFHVAVRVESSERGRVVEGLSRETRYTDKFESENVYYIIWEKSEEEILETLPEFRRSGVLKFLVVLTAEDEAATQSARPTASTSCQTTELQNTYDCLESLSHDFSKLLDGGSDPDVEFQCSGQSTAAHGAVVSARSEVFASMLSSDMLEGRTRIIKIPDIDPDVFRHFLRYIYAGTLPDLTLDLALNLYEVGDRYSVMGLARKCTMFLLGHLTVDNACGVLSAADAHSNKDLKEAVLRFMVENKVPQVSSCWPEFYGAHPVLAVEVLNRLCNAITK